MKTKTEILKETFEYYSDPSKRAVTVFGTCKYIMEDGRMCAVGRCLVDASRLKDVNVSVNDLKEKGLHLNRILKNDYRGHEIEFWDDLQMWHDSWQPRGHNFFSDMDVTKQGIEFYNQLLKKWRDK